MKFSLMIFYDCDCAVIYFNTATISFLNIVISWYFNQNINILYNCTRKHLNTFENWLLLVGRVSFQNILRGHKKLYRSWTNLVDQFSTKCGHIKSGMTRMDVCYLAHFDSSNLKVRYNNTKFYEFSILLTWIKIKVCLWNTIPPAATKSKKVFFTSKSKSRSQGHWPWCHLKGHH